MAFFSLFLKILVLYDSFIISVGCSLVIVNVGIYCIKNRRQCANWGRIGAQTSLIDLAECLNKLYTVLS